jgi:tetratricopeptide (TPR) repeat protein
VSRFGLRTFGEITLRGDSGVVALEEPHLVALLVMLAASGSEGMSDDDLMLRLYPDARREAARAELARTVDGLRTHLGGDSAIARTAAGWALAPGAVDVDFRVGDEPRAAARDDFLPGFKLPGSPEFRRWLDELRRRVEPAAPPGPARAHPSRARSILTVAILAFVLGTAAWLWRARTLEPFTTGDALLVSDVENTTGDTVFDRALASAAIIGLQQSGRLQLYPRARVPSVLRLMAVDDTNAALTYDLARDIAQREGIRFVLGLSIATEGAGYRVSSRLTDLPRGQSLVETALAPDKSEVVATLDRVLTTVRRQLGESRRQVAEHRGPLPRVVTSSLEALRSYADGAWSWDHGEYARASELWQRAVDLDTGFASAYSALGRYYYYVHDREQGERYLRAALSRRDRLTEREQLRLLLAEAFAHGRRDSAITVAKVIAERFPDASSWGNYATSLMQAQRNAEAIPAFRTALTFDSISSWSSGSWINLATTLSRLERYEESIAAYRRAEGVDSGALYRNNINHEYGMVLVRLGRLAEAESAYRRMAASPTVQGRAMGLRSLGYLAIWRGRIDEGIDQFQRAIEATSQLAAPTSVIRNRLLLAWSYRLAGRTAEADRQLDSVMTTVERVPMEPGFLTFVIGGLVKRHRVADADRVLRMLESRVQPENDVDRTFAAYASARVKLARGDARGALADARGAARLGQQALVYGLQADAFTAIGERDSAVAVLRKLTSYDYYGSEGQEEGMRAHIALGDALRAGGDTAGARAAYTVLLEQWREAPATLPDMVTVRERLTALDRASSGTAVAGARPR